MTSRTYRSLIALPIYPMLVPAMDNIFLSMDKNAFHFVTLHSTWKNNCSKLTLYRAARTTDNGYVHFNEIISKKRKGKRGDTQKRKIRKQTQTCEFDDTKRVSPNCRTARITRRSVQPHTSDVFQAPIRKRDVTQLCFADPKATIATSAWTTRGRMVQQDSTKAKFWDKIKRDGTQSAQNTMYYYLESKGQEQTTRDTSEANRRHPESTIFIEFCGITTSYDTEKIQPNSAYLEIYDMSMDWAGDAEWTSDFE